jgi:hypothetical protein
MTTRERPLSESLIKREFEKAEAKLRAEREKTKERSPERTVIDLQLKTLKDCEGLLWDIMLI